MQIGKTSAIAHPNIAFIKYWGNHDARLRLPLNDSLSMNLAALHTTTTVEFDPALTADEMTLNGAPADAAILQRVAKHLDLIRAQANDKPFARVASQNNFPAGSGIASSASAFAALTVAATHALGLALSERELSILARQGSGSASRSVPSGFVEWLASRDSAHSFARTIVAPTYWDLHDVIVIVSEEHKAVSSTDGHARSLSSHFMSERLDKLPNRFHHIRHALLTRDLDTFGQDIEAEAIELHMMAMTSKPPIFYWTPATVRIMHSVFEWRKEGLSVYFTLDAGPNVHLICASAIAQQIAERAQALTEIKQVVVSAPGNGAHIIQDHLF